MSGRGGVGWVFYTPPFVPCLGFGCSKYPVGRCWMGTKPEQIRHPWLSCSFCGHPCPQISDIDSTQKKLK